MIETIGVAPFALQRDVAAAAGLQARIVQANAGERPRRRSRLLIRVQTKVAVHGLDAGSRRECDVASRDQCDRSRTADSHI